MLFVLIRSLAEKIEEEEEEQATQEKREDEEEEEGKQKGQEVVRRRRSLLRQGASPSSFHEEGHLLHRSQQCQWERGGPEQRTWW